MSKHFSITSNKLRIADYFDNLKNKIDLLVEIYISDNQHDQVCIDEINKAREGWIKEADWCQAYNLGALEMNENKDELITEDQLFKRFCFFIYSDVDLYTSDFFTQSFISTDVYLRPGQIECFQELLKYNKIENNDLKVQTVDEDQMIRSLDKIFVDVKKYEEVSGRLEEVLIFCLIKYDFVLN
jgi:hypothetical protein